MPPFLMAIAEALGMVIPEGLGAAEATAYVMNALKNSIPGVASATEAVMPTIRGFGQAAARLITGGAGAAEGEAPGVLQAIKASLRGIAPPNAAGAAENIAAKDAGNVLIRMRGFNEAASRSPVDAAKAIVKWMPQQAASEGGVAAAAKNKANFLMRVLGWMKNNKLATAAIALPTAGMLIGRGEDDRRAEQTAMLQQQQQMGMGGGGDGMGKDLKNAMMLMQLAKLMQKAQDNSAEMTLPAGMRPADDATLLM